MNPRTGTYYSDCNNCRKYKKEFMEKSKHIKRFLWCSATTSLVRKNSYWYCRKHALEMRIKNAKHNGTKKQIESQRRSNRKKTAAKLGVKQGSLIVNPISMCFDKDRKYFQEALSSFTDLISGKKILIWDTVSDGKGGTHTLSKTREWFLRGLDDGKTLNLRRYLNDVEREPDPKYSDDSAAIKI